MQLCVAECGGKSQETFKTIPSVNALEVMDRKLLHDYHLLKQEFQIPQGILLFYKGSGHAIFTVSCVVS